MNQLQRAACLERACEYDAVISKCERVMRWIRGTGQLSDAAASALRDVFLRTAGDRATFVTGNWKPPELPVRADSHDYWMALWARIEAWEDEQGLTA